MAKYKRKHKKNSVLLIGIAVIAILIFISTGYALWSDTLYINGTANARYVEQKLDTITVNKTSDQYLEFEDDVGEDVRAFKVKSTELNNTEEKIEVVGNYDRRNWNVKKRDVMMRLNFVNNYPVTITNGQVTLLEDTTGYSITPTITETVANNQTGTLTITYHLKANSDLLSGTIKYKASYDVDGVTRYIYLTINITK
ncbi:MAG: hypothetical protein U0M00_05355 [Clostridia bacterium]|jgi:hypothetical protein|nr:hypothetical protein [Clostridia bacterium]